MRRRNREVYPHVEDAIGEDPARFLDRELDQDALAFLESRIEGIDELDVIGAWRGVEAKLVRTPDRADGQPPGRPMVRELLQRRARELETLGQRDDQLSRRREIVVDDDQDDVEDDQPTVWRHTAEDCGSIDVEQLSANAWQCDGCGQRVPKNRVEVVEREVIEA